MIDRSHIEAMTCWGVQTSHTEESGTQCIKRGISIRMTGLWGNNAIYVNFEVNGLHLLSVLLFHGLEGVSKWYVLEKFRG